MTMKSKFTQSGANFIGSPVIYRDGSRDIIAGQASDGRIFLLDGANLTTPLTVSSPIARLGTYRPAALTTWKDSSGQRWLLSTTPTSLVAHKLNVDGTSATLLPGWTLDSMKLPVAPLVVGGVVFVVSAGDRSNPAVLYGLNGTTGEKLYSSGKEITTFVPQNAVLWNSMGQILIGAFDSTLYSFGMNMERHL